MPSPFYELAEWVALKYDVDVPYICYDIVRPQGRPRLDVVLEWEKDKRKFSNGPNFDTVKQDCIKSKFESLLREQGILKRFRYKTNGLFVIFSAFESVARIEANEKVSDDALEQLKQQIKNPDLWTISRLFDGVTFFFFTDAQVKSYESKGARQQYSKEYARLVAPYDEFGYLAKTGIHVRFDSKENFDTNYKGNWFYYYR